MAQKKCQIWWENSKTTWNAQKGTLRFVLVSKLPFANCYIKYAEFELDGSVHVLWTPFWKLNWINKSQNNIS